MCSAPIACLCKMSLPYHPPVKIYTPHERFRASTVILLTINAVHLNDRQAHFRISTADMSDPHCQAHIPNHF
ncbi:hypothetical protein BFO01nite_34580 [Brevibacillus formosus]|uniref:Uncharacterized protein n=1 Tax=Brevibacillus formosus TaxID=54913 RepID=A0ABQ0T7M9_9BACL|nr:hypothetical protein BFO01nite_34580 [Brevibacillus formosus]